jgi:hypothetical protein
MRFRQNMMIGGSPLQSPLFLFPTLPQNPIPGFDLTVHQFFSPSIFSGNPFTPPPKGEPERSRSASNRHPSMIDRTGEGAQLLLLLIYKDFTLLWRCCYFGALTSGRSKIHLPINSFQGGDHAKSKRDAMEEEIG